MDLVELLKDARRKISLPENWTQGEMARSSEGKEVNPYSIHAVSWCMAGALQSFEGAAGEAWLFMTKALGVNSLVHINDNPQTSHADIMAMFDRAIALAEKGSRDAQMDG